jgi:hypothetical protein
MASGKYEAYSQLILNYVFNGGTFAQPSNLYLALFSVAPTVSSTGTEATGSGYARLTVACNTTNWPTISSTTTTITNNVAQTMATATGNWSSSSNQTDAGLWSASSSGTLYYWGDLTTAKPILSGDTPSFAISALSVQEL